MKTSRKSLRKLLPLLLLPSLLFVSCEQDNLDLRDDLVGTYDFTIKAYINTGNDLEYIGDQDDLYDVTGTVQVRKSTEYGDMVDFYDNGNLMFQGMNVRETDNSIVFDLPVQEFWLGSIPVTVRGFDYWNVENRSYHGAYLYNDESIEIGLAAEVMDVSSDLVLVFLAFKY